MNNFKIKDAFLSLELPVECIDEILKINPDKIYLYAKTIKTSDNGFELDLDSKNCLVGLNDKTLLSIREILINYGVKKDFFIPTVSQIRSGEVEGILFSAGVIAKNKYNKCLMVERDSGAPTEPKSWQFPSGRCEEIIAINTAKNEINEEISVIDNITKELISIADNIKTKHSDYLSVNISVDSVLFSENKNFAVIDYDFNTLEQYYFSDVTNNNHRLKDNEFGRNVDYISLNMINKNEIKMIKLLNKEKLLFSKCFKPSLKEIKHKLR